MDATEHDLQVEPRELTAADDALVERARRTVERAYDPEGFADDEAHTVGAAIRTTDGDVYTGVSVPTSVGRLSMCGEQVALGRAIAEGETAFEASVAVRHPRPDQSDFSVITPCGGCRELLYDYGPDVEALFPHDGQVRKAPVRELLPTRHW